MEAYEQACARTVEARMVYEAARQALASAEKAEREADREQDRKLDAYTQVERQLALAREEVAQIEAAPPPRITGAGPRQRDPQ